MLIESVIKEARPFLTGQKVRDMSIGISLIGLALDNGNIGVSYVLRENLKAGCSIFPYGQRIIDKDALDIAQWAVNGGDDLQKGIGIAVLCAASASQNLLDCDTPDKPFGLNLQFTDTVGMIGFIEPVAKAIRSRVNKIYIFDKAISMIGGAEVIPVKEQPNILPKCDIIVLSGTTMINGSIDSLLDMSPNAREIIMIGSSTPMFPSAFQNTKISVLAGAWWKKEHKEDLLKAISSAAGIRQVSSYSIKKTVPVQGPY